MDGAVYNAVLLHVDELTPGEREALADRLKDAVSNQMPAPHDWQARFDALISSVAVVGGFTDRREDWYGIGGR